LNTVLRLNRNEYFFHHPEEVSRLLEDGDAFEGRRYTPPEVASAFHTELAHALGLPQTSERASLCLFHGAEDALLKILLWKAPRLGNVVLPSFSWSNYASLAEGLGLAAESFPVNVGSRGFSYDLDALDALLSGAPKPRLVLLATPNNPTGHALSLEAVVSLVEKHPKHTFVVDAVYDAFSASLFSLPQCHANVFVLGSMSKFFGLPGLRLGFGVGLFPRSFTLALGFNPYALKIARAALQRRAHYQANWDAMQEQANLLFQQTRDSPDCSFAFTPFETRASFFLVRLEARLSERQFDTLVGQSGVLPKAFEHEGKRYLRFGLGPADVCARIAVFLGAFSKMADGPRGAP
jgi:histidinol-phosphate aminotransferase